MTIFQSEYGKLKHTPPRPQTAGAVHAVTFEFSLTEDLTASDLIEIGTLPAYAQAVDAILVPEGTLTGLTAKVGLMSGEAGNAVDTDRTLTGDLLFDDITLDEGAKRLENSAAFKIAKSDSHRGLCVKLSGALTGAVSNKLTLVLFYRQ